MIDHLKKPDMAREAEKLLEGAGWLPEPMRTPVAEADAQEMVAGEDEIVEATVGEEEAGSEEAGGRSDAGEADDAAVESDEAGGDRIGVDADRYGDSDEGDWDDMPIAAE